MTGVDVPGTPRPITHRRIVAIAVPVVLSNATVPILGAVDTGVVGQLCDPALIGGVAVGATVLSAVYWVFGFLRMGTAGLTSQAFGRGDRAEVDANLSRALLVGALGGLAIILLQVPIFATMFALAPASDRVEALARDYMAVRVLSAPAAIALYGVTGWLIAAERTRAVLAVQVWTNGFNIALDLLFVLALGWGIEGVATATVIAEWTGIAVGLWFCRDGFRAGYWRTPARVFDLARLRLMAVVNTDIMIRSVLLQAVFLTFVFVASDFGDVELAANQILLQFLMITAFALDGFAFAAEAIVGQAYGGGRRDQVRRGAAMTALWGAVMALGLALVFALGGGVIIDLLAGGLGPEGCVADPTAIDGNAAVRAAARDYLPWMVAVPVVGVAAWMLDGVFIGATRTADMRNMMAVSVAIYGVAVALLVPLFGNHGLWAALLVSFVARGVTLGLRYPELERAARPAA